MKKPNTFTAYIRKTVTPGAVPSSGGPLFQQAVKRNAKRKKKRG